MDKVAQAVRQAVAESQTRAVGGVERQTTCVVCGKPIVQPRGRGRPRMYCSDTCRFALSDAKRIAAKRQK